MVTISKGNANFGIEKATDKSEQQKGKACESNLNYPTKNSLEDQQSLEFNI